MEEKISKALKVVVGLLLVIAGIYGIIRFWPHVWDLLKGGVGIVVLLIGLIVLAIGFLD